MRVVRGFVSILGLVSCVVAATPASAQTVRTRPSAVTFVQSPAKVALGGPSRQLSLFRQNPAASQSTGYGSGYGAGVMFGFLLMRFDGYTRPFGLEVAYWYALNEMLSIDALYSFSHRGTGAGGGAYGGDNIISAMGGVDYQLTQGKTGRKVSVGVLAGLAHEFGTNALAVVPQATCRIPINDKLDFYVRGGFRVAFVTNATAKGIEAAFGIAKPFGK